jgi:hypothetical protein
MLAGPHKVSKYGWTGFIESVKAHPKVVEYVQKIETDRIASRVGRFNAENPNALRPSDRFRGLEDNPTPEMMSTMDSFIENFRPDRGDRAFEQLLEMQKQTDPNNAELHESTTKIRQL